MSIVPVKYPLDLSGKAVTNRVTDEPHVLNNANIRVFVPRHAAFFTDTVSVRDAATDRVLVRGVDYFPGLLYTQVTRQTGQEVHQIIIIKDQTCGPNVLFTAQMVGGEYSYSYDAIVQLASNLDLDNRPILFDAIIGKPDEYPPTPHLHDVGDVYGFEYVVGALERVRQAILMGSAPAVKGAFDYIDNQIAQIRSTIETLIDIQTSAASISAALGYVPASKDKDEVFGGVKTFAKGIINQGSFREKIKRINATTNATVLDLAQASIFIVTLGSSTSFSFSLANVAPAMTGDESISFTLVVKNDGVAGRAIAFGNNVRWADKAIPPRTPGAGAQDEYYFSSFDGGITWTGSLSNQNVGQVA